MTTTTPTLGLVLWDSSGDQTVTFADFRAYLTGPAVTSNMYKIDTAAGTYASAIAALQLTKGSVFVSATYDSPGTYLAAAVSGITAYTTGLTIILAVSATTSGTTTLNINSLGAKSLMKVNSSGTAINLTGSDLVIGRYYLFRYDGTRWLWVCANSADQIQIVGTSGNVVTVGSTGNLEGTVTQSVLMSGTAHAATAKTTPADSDEFPITDSAASYILKRLTWGNIKTALSLLYAALAGSASQIFSVGTATAIANAIRADSLQTQEHVAYTTGGTSTAYTLTTGFATPVALTTNERWHVIFNATAGATPTLNRDSKGAKSLKYYDYSGTKQSCGATSIIANMRADVVYDGTDYVLVDPLTPFIPTTTALSDFQLGNGSGVWEKKTLAETRAIIEPGLINGVGATLTISSGSITPTHKFHVIDTESGAATDDLDDISGANAQNGDILILRTTASTRDVQVVDGSGTIRIPANVTLSTLQSTITLVWVGSFWAGISSSIN